MAKIDGIDTVAYIRDAQDKYTKNLNTGSGDPVAHANLGMAILIAVSLVSIAESMEKMTGSGDAQATATEGDPYQYATTNSGETEGEDASWMQRPQASYNPATGEWADASASDAGTPRISGEAIPLDKANAYASDPAAPVGQPDAMQQPAEAGPGGEPQAPDPDPAPPAVRATDPVDDDLPYDTQPKPSNSTDAAAEGNTTGDDAATDKAQQDAAGGGVIEGEGAGNPDTPVAEKPPVDMAETLEGQAQGA